MEEIWKEVEDTGGRYLVSNTGRVYDYKLEKELSPIWNGGYLTLNITYSGEKVLDKLHRVVAKSFIPKPDDRCLLVIHIDEDRANNHKDNLEWKTHKLFGVGENKPRKYSPAKSKKAENSWCCMLQRCYSKKTPHYDNYGGRGAFVSEEWLDFLNFQEWYIREESRYTNKTWLEVDKDILIKDNLMYSEEVCALVPRELNNLFRRGIAMDKVTSKKIRDKLLKYDDQLPQNLKDRLEEIIKQCQE